MIKISGGNKGFTLVELAIVLVIIGLILGAIIRGQAIMENAKTKRFISDLKGITAAYYTYYDRYDAYPGDDQDGNDKWTSVANGNGNGLVEGTSCSTGPADGQECNEAWQSLRLSLIIKGDPSWVGAPALPATPYGGVMYLSNMSFGSTLGTRNFIGVTNVPGTIARRVDTSLDDGIYNSGFVQSSGAYTSATVGLYYVL